jgi:hypothetical protein
MSSSSSSAKYAWLGCGLVLGLVVGGFLPHAPLHAVATDRHENFALATGIMDNGIEGVFFLDSLTGNLQGAVINPIRGAIGVTYSRNVQADMKVDLSKSPKFMMVTGQMEVRGPGGAGQYAQTVIYIAEATSGMIACYAMPFNRAALNNSVGGASSDFILLFAGPFRAAVVR